MNEAQIKTFLLWCLYAPIAVSSITAIALILCSIFHDIKTKKQLNRFEELYKQCAKKYGLDFAKKLYTGCTEPYIGLTKTIEVFEHHCNAEI